MAPKKTKKTNEGEDDTNDDEVPREGPLNTFECKICGKDDFTNKGDFLNHYRIDHKKLKEDTLDEMEELRRIMVDSGARKKIEAVINLFSSSDPNDMGYLAYALGLAAYSKPLRNLILEGWKKYLLGQGKTPLNMDKIDGPKPFMQQPTQTTPVKNDEDEELKIMKASRIRRLREEEKARMRLEDERAKALLEKEIKLLKGGSDDKKEENRFEALIKEQRRHTDTVINALKEELKTRDELHRREIEEFKKDKEKTELRNKFRELEDMISTLAQQIDKRDMKTKDILNRFASEVKEDKYHQVIEALKDQKNSGGFADQLTQLAMVRDTLTDLFDSDGKIKKKEGVEKIFDKGLDIANKLLTKDPNAQPQQFPSPGFPAQNLANPEPKSQAQERDKLAELNKKEKERLELEKERLEIEKEKLEKIDAIIRSQKEKEQEAKNARTDETSRATPPQDDKPLLTIPNQSDKPNQPLPTQGDKPNQISPNQPGTEEAEKKEPGVES